MDKIIDATVFPSEQKTIRVNDSEDIYGGAHNYFCKLSMGFDPETQKPIYLDQEDQVSFVYKRNDGKMRPGLQSEQLALVLMDRCVKLNNRFPSPQNKKMIAGLQMFLDACKERVCDRMNRGVMGELKK